MLIVIFMGFYRDYGSHFIGILSPWNGMLIGFLMGF